MRSKNDLLGIWISALSPTVQNGLPGIRISASTPSSAWASGMTVVMVLFEGFGVMLVKLPNSVWASGILVGIEEASGVGGQAHKAYAVTMGLDRLFAGYTLSLSLSIYIPSPLVSACICNLHNARDT